MEKMEMLTRLHGSFEAHVLAARLRSEGIDVQLRGNVDGPYAVSVGDLGIVDVYVAAHDLETASLLLLETEVDDTLESASTRRAARVPWELRLLVGVLVALGLWPLLRHVVAS